MPLSRRATRSVAGSIWPGFVDAVTSLLMVMMFVLTIFMVVQFVLSEEISGQRSELDVLTDEVARLTETLGQARDRAAAAEAANADLRAETETQAARIATLLSQRDTARAEAVDLSQALAAARDEIDAEAEAARLAAARADALEALTADLRADLSQARAERQALSGEVEDLSRALDAEETARLVEAEAAEALRARLEASDAELNALSLALEEARQRAEETMTLLAAARVAQADLTDRLSAAVARGETLEAQRADLRASLEAERETEAELRDRLSAALAGRDAAQDRAAARASEAERQAALLAQARDTLAERDATSEEQQRRIEVLNRQVADLRSRIASLETGLETANAAAEAEIADLDRRLAAALVREAEEQRRRAELEAEARQRLERYRSEFFGQLRDVLADREGVRIVGDRFVFDSEVLFPSGSATLSAGGRAQVAEVAALLEEVSDQIPDGIDWVVRVDGHTDGVPVGAEAPFADNWELSQARALSVVRYMSEELGFPADRLAPTGFGEYRPLTEGTTSEARAQNRRIELKLTER